MEKGMPSNPMPAATVAVLRDREEGGFEVFLLKRSAKTRFMPHVHVFPGGRVDPGDAVVEISGGEQDRHRMGCPDAAAYQAAAIRETYEESGVLLARGRLCEEARLNLQAGRETLAQVSQRLGWVLTADRLVYWSWWITPEAEPRRYDTRFFVAGVDRETAARHDDSENVQSAWFQPQEALDSFLEGDILLAPPTVRTLTELQDYASVAAVLEGGKTRRTPPIEPRLYQDDEGVLHVVLPGDPGYPAEVSVEGPTRMAIHYARRWLGDR